METTNWPQEQSLRDWTQSLINAQTVEVTVLHISVRATTQ